MIIDGASLSSSQVIIVRPLASLGRRPVIRMQMPGGSTTSASRGTAEKAEILVFREDLKDGAVTGRA